jgi:hypothetical protein
MRSERGKRRTGTGMSAGPEVGWEVGPQSIPGSTNRNNAEAKKSENGGRPAANPTVRAEPLAVDVTGY